MIFLLICLNEVIYLQVVDCKLPGNDIDIHGYMAILLIPLLAISMIRSLKVSYFILRGLLFRIRFDKIRLWYPHFS